MKFEIYITLNDRKKLKLVFPEWSYQSVYKKFNWVIYNFYLIKKYINMWSKTERDKHIFLIITFSQIFAAII